MKRIFRMLIFTAIAIYTTSLWNKGFLIHMDLQTFLKSVVIIAIIYYLIFPLSKIILLPLNILTLGLMSTFVYFLLFYLFIARYGIVNIQPWVFQGMDLFGFSIQKTNISYVVNIVLSSFSISLIINFLERFL